MWLLDKMLRKVITKGELVVTDYDGKVYRYGSPDPGIRSVNARLTDKGAAFHIAKDPRVGAGEAYMDGRVVIEPPADIRDLVLLIRYNAPAESQDALKPRGPLRKSIHYAVGKVDQINWKSRSRRNAEHTYNLTRQLYELFLDEDRQYTMAYYRDTGNSLEKAQLDKKAHIASKLYLKPGMKVLDIGCGWGGFAMYLKRPYAVDVAGVARTPHQMSFFKEGAGGSGGGERGKV